MKIHHLRNATFIIEHQDRFILVDPMLGKKGSGSPFTLFRFKPLKNPTIELPAHADQILSKVTHGLVTHLHPDHIDDEAISFLKERNIPIVCSALDRKVLAKKGLRIELALTYDAAQDYLDGRIVGIMAVHGYGFVRKIAGNVMGFYLELPDGPSIYISSDTVYTEHVDQALQSYQPDITVVAAGMAQLDLGKLLLMDRDDILRLVHQAPGRVLANHMEALNHCPNTRADLRELLQAHDLLTKVDIPEDGETVTYG